MIATKLGLATEFMLNMFFGGLELIEQLFALTAGKLVTEAAMLLLEEAALLAAEGGVDEECFFIALVCLNLLNKSFWFILVATKSPLVFVVFWSLFNGVGFSFVTRAAKPFTPPLVGAVLSESKVFVKIKGLDNSLTGLVYKKMYINIYKYK